MRGSQEDERHVSLTLAMGEGAEHPAGYVIYPYLKKLQRFSLGTFGRRALAPRTTAALQAGAADAVGGSEHDHHLPDEQHALTQLLRL